MNRFLKTAILGTAVVATTLTAFSAANADDRWRYHHRNHGGDAVAAGVLGLAVGALAVGALNTPPPPPRYRYYEPDYRYAEPDYTYVEPRRVYRERPRRVYVQEYAAPLEPWSPAWYRYCEGRYRTFDARSGTYVGYDGQEHFCNAG